MSLAATLPQLPLPTTVTFDLEPTTLPSFPKLFTVSVWWGAAVWGSASWCGGETGSKAGAIETKVEKWEEEKMSGNEEMKLKLEKREKEEEEYKGKWKRMRAEMTDTLSSQTMKQCYLLCFHLLKLAIYSMLLLLSSIGFSSQVKTTASLDLTLQTNFVMTWLFWQFISEQKPSGTCLGSISIKKYLRPNSF